VLYSSKSDNRFRPTNVVKHSSKQKISHATFIIRILFLKQIYSSVNYIYKHQVPISSLNELKVLSSLLPLWARRSDQQHLAPLTFDDVCALYKEHFKYDTHRIKLIEQEFSGRAMDDISSLDIRRFKKKILETQRATTWNRYRNILNAVFNRGIEWEMCARNPVAPVKRESDTRVREFLSEDQADALLREAKKDSFFLYALVLTALKTGRRLSELLHLEWRYVDFEKGRIMFMISKKKGGSEEFYQLPPRIVFQTLSLLKNVNDEKPFPYFPRREWRKVRDNIEKTSGFWTSVSTGLGIDALRR